MNACKAIELALKDTIARHSAVGGGVWLRAEQSQTKDADFEERRKAERFFPQVYISASPEESDDNGWTFGQSVSLVVATHLGDDPFSQTRAEIYDALRKVVDLLYFQALDPQMTPREELTYFNAQFSGYMTGATVYIGGITLPGGSAPSWDGDVQTIGVVMMFHWYMDETTIT
jgi:hypothetical protein